MSDLLFREGREEDMREIRRIAIAAWTPIHAHFRQVMGEELYLRVTPPGSLELTGDTIVGIFREHPETSFITELDGTLVGFCTYAPHDNGVGSIGYNAVDPACQGRGVGTAQYEECLRRMRMAGMIYATVRTGLDESHPPARRAYEKVGFLPLRPQIDYFLKL